MSTEQAHSGRTAGVAMIVAAGGVVIAMAHHPTSVDAGPLVGIVHGAMIVLMTVLAWGFLLFAIERGPTRPLIVGGALAYMIGLFGNMIAGTINGFVVATLAREATDPIDPAIFRFAWDFNQALATLAVWMTGAAYVLWSFDLLREGRTAPRLTGMAGLLAGSAPVAMLALNGVRMNVAGAMIVYAIQVVWAALVGVMLLNGALHPRPNDATSS